jgi:hypothetical protein
VSWWTRDGWEWTSPPAPFKAAYAAADRTTPWDKVLREHGYEEVFRYGRTADYLTDIEIVVCRHADDQHLLVQLGTEQHWLTEFFVRSAAAAAFCVERLPVMLSGYRVAEAPHIDPRIRAEREADYEQALIEERKGRQS